MLTPEIVHTGRATQVHAKRQATLDASYAGHPERFVNQFPTPPDLPSAAWINKPETIPPTWRSELMLSSADVIQEQMAVTATG